MPSTMLSIVELCSSCESPGELICCKSCSGKWHERCMRFYRPPYDAFTGSLPYCHNCFPRHRPPPHPPPPTPREPAMDYDVSSPKHLRAPRKRLSYTISEDCSGDAVARRRAQFKALGSSTQSFEARDRKFRSFNAHHPIGRGSK